MSEIPPEYDYEKARKEEVHKLHDLINKYWCSEFEYGESCKHCTMEQMLCEPLAEVLYPGIWDPPDDIAVREEE